MAEVERVQYEGQSFDVMEFSEEDLVATGERSKYPFEADWLTVGKSFLVRKPQSSVSGTVSSQSKKGERVFKTKQTTNPAHGESSKGANDGASKEHPFTWVIRIK